MNDELNGPASDRVIVGAFVDAPLKCALVKRAAKNERSVSAEIRVALREHLQAPSEYPADEIVLSAP